MAKVKERNPNTVSPGALRGGMITARVSETAVGVGLGNVISEEGRKIYEQQKQYQDDIVFMDGVRAIGDRENQLLHDPENGAYSRKGGDVRGVYESTTAELDKSAADIMKNMHPRQQARMQEYYARRRATTQRELLKHTAAEMSAFDTEQTNAFVERELETAMFNWNNPELRNEAVRNAKGAMSAYGVRNGKSADWIKGKHTKIDQAAHAGTIDRMIAADKTTAAVAYLGEHERDMAHEDRVRIIEQMNSATDRKSVV